MKGLMRISGFGRVVTHYDIGDCRKFFRESNSETDKLEALVTMLLLRIEALEERNDPPPPP